MRRTSTCCCSLPCYAESSSPILPRGSLAGFRCLTAQTWLIVVMTFIALLGATVFFFGWRIDHQLRQTSQLLDESFDKVKVWVDRSPTAGAALGRIPFLDDLLPDDLGEFGSIETNGAPGGSDRDGRSSSNSEERADEATSAGWTNIATINSVSGTVFEVLGKLFATSLGVSMNFAFVFFVGVFLAIKPHLYRDNFARLFPQALSKSCR